MGECQPRNLDDERSKPIHDGTSWSKVVERDEGVHLELGAREQTLHHDKAGSLEDDTSDLVEETSHVELNLSVRCNDDSNDDEGDIA